MSNQVVRSLFLKTPLKQVRKFWNDYAGNIVYQIIFVGFVRKKERVHKNMTRESERLSLSD